MQFQRLEYPRPQFKRDEWLPLNGEWEFEFDDNNQGEIRLLQKGKTPLQTVINVPFAYQTKASGIFKESEVHETVWYRRTFTLPKNGKRALLCFNGADHLTNVWVNGFHVLCHEGAYTPFSADITDFLTSGENVIVVKCYDPLDATFARGKQSWLDGKRFECWYIPETGIWQSVWIEFFEEDCMDAYSVLADVKTNSVKGTLRTLYGKGKQAEITVSQNGETLMQKTVDFGGRYADFSLSFAENGVEYQLWSPEAPNLYDITFVLKKDGATLDTAVSRFGMREIAIIDGKICLNGKPFYQRLILDQGYYKDSGTTPPSVEALKKDLEYTKAMGFNGARKHQKFDDPYFYYLADELGLVTWCEMPSAYRFNADLVKNVSTEWAKIVELAQSFTSVVAYVPLNESWGVPAIGQERKQVDFARTLFYLTKSIDNTRIVSFNDGWQNTTDSDIITVHDYAADSSKFKERYDSEEGLRTSEILNKKVLLGEWQKIDKPVLFSEFGGIAMQSNTVNDNWGYGESAKGNEEFYNRVENLVKGIFACGFQGYCYTQLSDIQQEVNGLLDENHEPKFDNARLKKIFENK